MVTVMTHLNEGMFPLTHFFPSTGKDMIIVHPQGEGVFVI